MSDLPESCERAYNIVRRKDRRYFERNPDKLEYTRSYIYGEFWPMHVAPGVRIKVYNVGRGVPLRHALTNESLSFPGYEEEYAAAKAGGSVLRTEADVDAIVATVREDLRKLDE